MIDQASLLKDLQRAIDRGKMHIGLRCLDCCSEVTRAHMTLRSDEGG